MSTELLTRKKAFTALVSFLKGRMDDNSGDEHTQKTNTAVYFYFLENIEYYAGTFIYQDKINNDSSAGEKHFEGRLATIFNLYMIDPNEEGLEDQFKEAIRNFGYATGQTPDRASKATLLTQQRQDEILNKEYNKYGYLTQTAKKYHDEEFSSDSGIITDTKGDSNEETIDDTTKIAEDNEEDPQIEGQTSGEEDGLRQENTEIKNPDLDIQDEEKEISAKEVLDNTSNNPSVDETLASTEEGDKEIDDPIEEISKEEAISKENDLEKPISNENENLEHTDTKEEDKENSNRKESTQYDLPNSDPTLDKPMPFESEEEVVTVKEEIKNTEAGKADTNIYTPTPNLALNNDNPFGANGSFRIGGDEIQQEPAKEANSPTQEIKNDKKEEITKQDIAQFSDGNVTAISAQVQNNQASQKTVKEELDETPKPSSSSHLIQPKQHYANSQYNKSLSINADEFEYDHDNEPDLDDEIGYEIPKSGKFRRVHSSNSSLGEFDSDDLRYRFEAKMQIEEEKNSSPAFLKDPKNTEDYINLLIHDSKDMKEQDKIERIFSVLLRTVGDIRKIDSRLTGVEEQIPKTGNVRGNKEYQVYREYIEILRNGSRMARLPNRFINYGGANTAIASSPKVVLVDGEYWYVGAGSGIAPTSSAGVYSFDENPEKLKKVLEVYLEKRV